MEKKVVKNVRSFEDMQIDFQKIADEKKRLSISHEEVIPIWSIIEKSVDFENFLRIFFYFRKEDRREMDRLESIIFNNR